MDPVLAVRAILEGLRALGLDTASMIRGAGLNPTALASERGRVPDPVYATLWRAARKVGISPRALQRRLQAEGTRFADTVDDLRKEKALDALRAGGRQPSVLELALELGFADDRAFSRAFGRWTGMSPRRWRRSEPC
ncbi:helix-turn-helix domain-containing protein [Myxococcota bacterium]